MHHGNFPQKHDGFSPRATSAPDGHGNPNLWEIAMSELNPNRPSAERTAHSAQCLLPQPPSRHQLPVGHRNAPMHLEIDDREHRGWREGIAAVRGDRRLKYKGTVKEKTYSTCLRNGQTCGVAHSRFLVAWKGQLNRRERRNILFSFLFHIFSLQLASCMHTMVTTLH